MLFDVGVAPPVDLAQTRQAPESTSLPGSPRP